MTPQLKRVTAGIVLLAAIAALVTFAFSRHQRETAMDLRTPGPRIASPVPSTGSVVRPGPSQSTHFLPQLPPPQIVPRKPSIFRAPAKAKTGGPP